MNTTIRFPSMVASIVLLAAGLAACEDGRVRPPRVNVQVVHAAPTAPVISLYRGERPSRNPEAQLDYRSASPLLTFDEDQYGFSARGIDLVTGEPVILSSFSQTVSSGNRYLFVLTEVGGNVTPIIVENPVFESESETQVAAVHAAPGIASVDVFLEAPGADLSTATPLGNVAFRDVMAPATLEPGDYRLTLTAAGDPGNVLFSSSTMELSEGESHSFVLVDDTGDGVAPLAVVRTGSSSSAMFDRGVLTGVQFVNAAADEAARDMFVDADYTTPLVAALGYGSASDLMLVTPGTRDLSATPAGNPGVVDAEEELPATRGARITALLAGEAGDLSFALASDDSRRVAGQARLRFMNGASQHTSLDVFVVPPGTDVSVVRPQLEEMPMPGISSRIALAPGDREIVIRDRETGAIVYGPDVITFDAGLYTMLAVNGAASGTVDVLRLEDFN